MTKMAKCGLQKYSFCTHKHDLPMCETCVLIKRHGKMYKYIQGKKLKKCPRCGEYKPMSEFRPNSNGYISWCYDCHKDNARERKRTDRKQFLVSHRIDERKVHIEIDSVVALIKFVRECVNNNERLIEIKRI